MYGNNAYNAYKNNSVNYASKEQLLLMLVDGAVKYAKLGREALEEKDTKKSHENILKTQNIFTELMVNLDISKAGNWGQDLFNIYSFIKTKLVEANMKKDPKVMAEVLPIIEEVRDTWHEAYKLSKNQG